MWNSYAMKRDYMDLLENIGRLKLIPVLMFHIDDIFRQKTSDNIYGPPCISFFLVNGDFQFKLSDVCIVVWGRKRNNFFLTTPLTWCLNPKMLHINPINIHYAYTGFLHPTVFTLFYREMRCTWHGITFTLTVVHREMMSHVFLTLFKEKSD